jgi:DNA-directed RNA polymerase specialized sigma24 family protein
MGKGARPTVQNERRVARVRMSDSGVLQHRAWLLRLALRLCGSSADADDHVQDVLMKYHDNFPEGKGAPPDDLRRLA